MVLACKLFSFQSYNLLYLHMENTVGLATQLYRCTKPVVEEYIVDVDRHVPP